MSLLSVQKGEVMENEKKKFVGFISGGKLKKHFGSKKRIGLLAVLGIACVILLLLPKSGEAAQDDASQIKLDCTEYTAELEQKLESVISSVSGAGRTKVMLTLNGGTEFFYQTDTRDESAASNDAETSRGSEKNTVIVRNSSGTEAPVLKATASPAVNGVVVVCDGAAKSEVKESIQSAVKALLGISANRICILKMN